MEDIEKTIDDGTDKVINVDDIADGYVAPATESLKTEDVMDKKLSTIRDKNGNISIEISDFSHRDVNGWESAISRLNEHTPNEAAMVEEKEKEDDKKCDMCRRDDTYTCRIAIRDLSACTLSDEGDFGLVDHYHYAYLCHECMTEILQHVLVTLSGKEALAIKNKILSAEDWSRSVRIANWESYVKSYPDVHSRFTKESIEKRHGGDFLPLRENKKSSNIPPLTIPENVKPIKLHGKSGVFVSQEDIDDVKKKLEKLVSKEELSDKRWKPKSVIEMAEENGVSAPKDKNVDVETGKPFEDDKEKQNE